MPLIYLDRMDQDQNGPRRFTMSATDKVKNKAQTTKGEVKRVVGKVTKDRSLEAEGRTDKASGNLKQAGEKVKDAFKK